jgi:hypothetical protein
VSGPAVALLAVRLTRHHGDGDLRDAWCSMCGEHAQRRAGLLGGAHVAVCDACGGLAAEILDERRDAATNPPDAFPTLPPCCVCGGRDHLLYGPEAAVGARCARQASELLGLGGG